MKKILYVIALISILFASCSDWLDVNDDPNVPTAVSIDLVMPAVEASIAVQVGGFLFNVGGFYSQYWSQAPEANQYNTLDKFDIKTDFLNNVYSELYAGALNDIKKIRELAVEEKREGDYLAATVLRAYTFQLLVDLLGNAPYSEALQGTDQLSPKFEEGKVIYDGIVKEIDDALSKITPNSFVTSNDLLLGGDLNQWIGFANALKLKIFMRQSNTDNKHVDEIKKLLSDNKFMTKDILFTSFQDEVNKRNSWYDTEVDRLGGMNHVATKNIISYMVANNDPRISKIWNKAPNSKSYEGNYPAGKTIDGIKTADFSSPIMTPTTPICLYTLSELYFFIAEAQLVYNNDAAKAKNAYEKGINANLALHGIEIDGEELYGSGKVYEFDNTAKKISMQKWVSLALVNNIESFFETLRTGYPEICSSTVSEIMGDLSLYIPGDRIYPYENVLGKKVFLTRFYYPEISTTRNQNSPSQVKLTDKLWWAK